MHKRFKLAGAAMLALLASIPAAAQQAPPARTPENGYSAFNWDLLSPVGPRVSLLFGTWFGRPQTDQKRKPFKMFDNVYYVGIEINSALLITSRDNSEMILVDATFADTADTVLDNIRSLGFDPKNIKYVILTEGHFDHWLGASRIKAVTGARVATPLGDWTLIEDVQRRQAYGGSVPPAAPLQRDMVIRDGDTITIGGDTTLKFYVTPGHTPGIPSFEMPVRDGDKTYRALMAVPGINGGPEWTMPFIASHERLRALGPWDTLLPIHPFLFPDVDLFSFEDALAVHTPGTPHPMVIGPRKIDDFLRDILAVAYVKKRAEDLGVTLVQSFKPPLPAGRVAPASGREVPAAGTPR